MYDFKSIRELIDLAGKLEIDIGEIMIRREMERFSVTRSVVLKRMQENLQVMKDSVRQGVKEDIKSYTGLSGGDGKKFFEAERDGRTVTKGLYPRAVARAMGVAEVNAAMGKIVAAPTAGSCGVLPGTLLTVAEYSKKTDDDLIKALFVAAAIGLVIARNASLSGAEGGCQAECGSASAMTAGAVVYLLGGSEEQIAHGVAIALKNMLGLVCDPVAGLVEVPCVKRNAAATANALIAAEMSLAGIESKIPADQVIEAMGRVGKKLPAELKETSQGGLAATAKARKLEEELFGNKN